MEVDVDVDVPIHTQRSAAVGVFWACSPTQTTPAPWDLSEPWLQSEETDTQTPNTSQQYSFGSKEPLTKKSLPETMSRRYNTDNDSRKDDRYGRDDYYWHDDYDVNTEDADAPNPSKHKANGEGDPNRLKRARHP